MNKRPIEMPVVTREVYKAVKRYDRQQFNAFCLSVYESGYKDGRASVPGIDVEKVMEAIATVPGIGPKRMEQLRDRMDALLQEERNG